MHLRFIFPVIGVFIFVFSILFPAAASESQIIYNAAGKEMFRLNFLSVGESSTTGEFTSLYPLSPALRQDVIQSAQYIADMLGNTTKNTQASDIYIGTVDGFQSHAISYLYSTTNGGTITGIQKNLLNGNNLVIPAIIGISHADDLGKTEEIAPLPIASETEKGSFSSVLHEMLHLLGLQKAPLEAHIYDVYGHPLLGATVFETFENMGEGTFSLKAEDYYIDPRDGEEAWWGGGVYLNGDYIQDVLQGAILKRYDDSWGARTGVYTISGLPGIPLRGYEGFHVPDLSHAELRNGLMSHQNYRNYVTFMEAELAVLQEAGYQIDRRQYFGRSIYNDGLTLTNTNGYFARNADGTAYINGTYNPTMYGMGLHIYGNNNTVRQAADLLTVGAGAVGVRIDGMENKLLVDAQTKIHANGLNGAGIMASWGRQHQINIQGEVLACGTGGTGLRFDFGGNIFTHATSCPTCYEYYGSYIDLNESGFWLHPEIDGALISNADISGTVGGTKAAIFISDNAYVQEINLLNGAKLQGDIISEWNPDSSQIFGDYGLNNSFVTYLTFGRQKGANAWATNVADDDFSMRYDGNITAPLSMRLDIVGGRLSYNGTAKVLDVVVRENATLGGNGTYILSPANRHATGTLTNNGTLAAGNSIGRIEITGDYVQTPIGTLETEFNALGESDVLSVSGTATVNGTLLIKPLPDLYTGTTNIALTPIQAGVLAGAFSNISILTSPTIQMQFSQTGPMNFSVQATRMPNAYAQYATDGTTLQIGQGLDNVSLSSAMRPLYLALDFSNANGNGIRNALQSLSPRVYQSVGRAAIDRQHLLSDMLFENPQPMNANESNLTVTPFGASLHRSPHLRQNKYNLTAQGLMAQLRHQTENNVQLKAALTMMYGALDIQNQKKMTSQGAFVTVFADKIPARQTSGWTGKAGAYAGFDYQHIKRQVSFENYFASHQDSYTNTAAGAVFGFGYQWAFNPLTWGVFSGLDYGAIYQPQIRENGVGGSRMNLKSTTYQSLRSKVGMSIQTPARGIQENDKILFSANGKISWNHELLDSYGALKGQLTDHPTVIFKDKITTKSADTLQLDATLQIALPQNIDVDLTAGTELSPHGDDSVLGKLNFRWSF